MLLALLLATLPASAADWQVYTHSLGARHALRRLQESGTPCFGCIMNGVNLNSLSNYYYYRRYGGYAYRQYQAQATPPLAGDHRG